MLPLAGLSDGARRWCFVDLETTGSAAARERITEVGIVTVDIDGEALRVSEWASLVNPQRSIPAEIQWLTGITNDMVRGAPRFAEIADELLERLRDANFVAHNARFDYGFLRAEFARLGIPWRATTLCTVRLSRALYPDRSPHSLDAIVARFDLAGETRHRALGDAKILWRFIQRLYERRPRAEVDETIRLLLARSATPPMLAPNALDDVPAAPGVYLFFGLNAHPIYIGKSVDLRARVQGHFAADSSNAQDAKLAQEVCRIEWEETAGEIGALLREAELVKTRLPSHNIALRRRLNAVTLYLDARSRPKVAPASSLPLDGAQEHFGPFSSRASARQWLLALAREHALCLKTLGWERVPKSTDGDGRAAAGRGCFALQLHRCHGACVGEEPPQAHTARLLDALAPARIASWPFEGAIALIERNNERLREDVHVFDRWCYLGSVRTLDAALALARDDLPRRFDADVYRIARQALAAVAAGTLECVALWQLKTDAPPPSPAAAPPADPTPPLAH
ncbi:MAG: ethanolamine utilization protein [Burkholderiales bacterium]|nr:ethanolamine utilization protein [Burkholderiales bacterium]